MNVPVGTAMPRNTNALFAHASRNSERAIVPINDCALDTATPRPAFYCVHSASGVAGTDFLDLAKCLEPTIRFYGIQAPPKRMPEQAEQAELLRFFRPVQSKTASWLPPRL